jgi:hypothetical protein
MMWIRKRILRSSCGALIMTVAFMASSSAGGAACGHGTASYTDINAVRYERGGCFGHCPYYQVLFTRLGKCYYVGMKNVSKLGTYESSCSPRILLRAANVLRSRNFYGTDYDSSALILDTPHYIVSAERCGVTTILNWPAHGTNSRITGLMDDLDAITKRVKWRKISDSSESPVSGIATIP